MAGRAGPQPLMHVYRSQNGPETAPPRPNFGPGPTLPVGDNNEEKVGFMRILGLAGLVFLATSPAHAAQTVGATWYGNELRGHRTANGEVFNPDGHTAAHRSLPFGTCLLVGNPKTGQSVKVRVNDRGPFTSGLALDLSHGAARAIGMRSTQNVTMKKC